MANLLKSFVRKMLLAGGGNLVSLNDHYSIIASLLGKHEITGILDVGASHGRISRKFLRMFPDAVVYAFEPNPAYKDGLKHLASSEPRFKPQFLALTDKARTVELNVTRSPGSTSLFKPDRRLREMYPDGSVVAAVEHVKAVTIDGWVQRNRDVPIQLMKFDIQGGELKAMQGAACTLQTSCLLVYTEILFNPLYEGGAIYSEIDLYLRECGYLLYDMFKPRYNRNGLLVWANAVFVHKERLDI